MSEPTVEPDVDPADLDAVSPGLPEDPDRAEVGDPHEDKQDEAEDT